MYCRRSQRNEPYTDLIIPGSIVFSNEGAEPVTLDEVKAYIMIAGTAYDNIITQLLKAAREWVEKKTGLSLVTRDIECTVHVVESVELPYGPIDPDSVQKSDDSTVITDLTPGSFPQLTLAGITNVKYSAGYTADTIPGGLKTAIMARCAATFENRGDKTTDYSAVARSHYISYIRLLPWV